MDTALGHLTFCTNIFPGESWNTHFDILKREIPAIKKRLAPHKTFGIGLRLSNKASLELIQPKKLTAFKNWLHENDCAILTMNGFPYGNFHRTKIKDQVHSPDWTAPERLDYTSRLFKILSSLLPENGVSGISTSPLSYKYWFKNDQKKLNEVTDKCTKNLVDLVLELYQTHKETGKLLHIDIEPEADGLLENSDEFIDWYLNRLLPTAIKALKEKFLITDAEAEAAIKQHVQLCYDVCHFAVGFEDVEDVLDKLEETGIRVGKCQLSTALKVNLKDKKVPEILEELRTFDEPVYLHQVVARDENGSLLRYRDLPDAFSSPEALQTEEWRSHFHVPLFVQEYGLLQSTQEDVAHALQVQKERNISDCLEIETYTWDVLPDDLKQPLTESIIREMEWVIDKM